MEIVETDAQTGVTTVRVLTQAEEAAVLARRQQQTIQAAKVVTPRQAKLALLESGLLNQVEAAVAASDRATQISWEYATEFNRDDPLIIGLGAQLGLTPEQIDQLFIAASQL